MDKQRLWIISELFPPDETSTAFILGEIANVMTQKYEVKVICGPEIYDKRKKIDNDHRFEISSDIEVLRAKGVETDKNTFIGKAIRFAVVSRQLYRLAKCNIRKEDKVLLVTNPAPMVVMVSKLKKKIGFELHILVHDVFPENTIPAGLKLPKFVYRMTKGMFDAAYGRADQLIALGRDMKEVLGEKVRKANKETQITIIQNWADLDIVSPKKRDVDVGKERKIDIGYAGNIGRVQGLREFLEHLRMSGNECLSFHLWGTGAEENALKEYAREYNLANVFFHGPYFRSKQADIINGCDIALVTLTEGMYGLGVPSKTYNIMAAGKPILYIGEDMSEIGLLVKEKSIGYVFTPEDKSGVLAFLKNLTSEHLPQLREMGLRSRKVAEEEYAKDVILKRFLNVI